jgi:HEAT repeat protein
MSVEALLRLRDRGAEEAVPQVLPLLGADDPMLRATAANVLGELGAGDPEAVERALVRALADPEAIVRSEVADALGILGFAGAAPALQRVVLDDPDATVRASAAESLGDFAQPAALAALALALRDDDEAVRGYAAGAIGRIGAPGALEDLGVRLEGESSPRVRAELLAARYRLGDASALDELIELLGTADRDTAETLLNVVEDLPAAKRDAPRFEAALARLRTGLAEP